MGIGINKPTEKFSVQGITVDRNAPKKGGEEVKGVRNKHVY